MQAAGKERPGEMEKEKKKKKKQGGGEWGGRGEKKMTLKSKGCPEG